MWLEEKKSVASGSTQPSAWQVVSTKPTCPSWSLPRRVFAKACLRKKGMRRMCDDAAEGTRTVTCIEDGGTGFINTHKDKILLCPPHMQ